MPRSAAELRQFFSRYYFARSCQPKGASLCELYPVSCALPISRCFTSDAHRSHARNVPSGAIAAFPFLSKISPSEAAQIKSFGAAAEQLLSGSTNVRVVRDMDSFESEVYRRPPKPVAIFFAAKSNNTNIRILEEFAATAAASGGVADFLVVDVDEVPRAAYHCGVEDACTLVVQYNVDAFRRRIYCPLGIKRPQELVLEMKAALDQCIKAAHEEAEQLTEWYTHGIPVDNLNVYRVNWPTA